MNLAIARITVPRTDASKPLCHAIALALLSEVGLSAAAKESGKSVWHAFTEQATAIQAETSDTNDRKARMGQFLDSVKAEARSAALVELAHSLGLDRFTRGNEKAKEKQDNSSILVDRALKKAQNYVDRINGAWELGVVLVSGISAGKLEDAKRTARNAAAEAKEKTEGVPVHIALQRSGASLSDCASLAAATGSPLTAEGMAVAERLLQDCNKLIVQMMRGLIQPEQVAELADMAELAIDESVQGEPEGEASGEADVMLSDIPEAPEEAADEGADAPMEAVA